MPEKIGLGQGMPFAGPTGAGGGGGPTPLSPGVYWADGVVSLAPNVGNYASTTQLTDGDTTGSGEQASVDQMTWVHVLASPISLTSWQNTVFFKGGLSLSYSYWNGSAWVALLDNSGSPSPFNSGYASFTLTATFGGAPSATIFRAVGDETDTDAFGIKVTDSRPS